MPMTMTSAPIISPAVPGNLFQEQKPIITATSARIILPINIEAIPKKKLIMRKMAATIPETNEIIRIQSPLASWRRPIYLTKDIENINIRYY